MPLQLHNFRSKTIPHLILFTLLSIITLSLNVSPVAAATLTVTNLNDTGAGSLRQTIIDAVDGDVIQFAAGLNGTITFGSVIFSDKQLVINGDNRITLSGNSTTQLFSLNGAANFTLNDLTIINGNAPIDGGAIFLASGTSLAVNSSTFDNNSAEDTFRGGAIFGIGNNIITINNSTFTNNGGNSVLGGVLTVINGTISINNSTFENNLSIGNFSQGGAIANDSNSVMTITNSSFSNNTANQGGAIYHQGASLTLDNVIFNSNTSVQGGALYLERGATTITNSRFTDQELATGTSGGAIYSTNNITNPGDISVTGSCFVNNAKTAVVRVNTAHTYNFTGNWWGRPDGPAGAGTGTGDTVSAGINFAGYLTSAPADCGTLSLAVSVTDSSSNTIVNGGSFDFGTTPESTPISETFTVTNTGTSTAQLSNLGVPTGFSISQSFASTTLEPQDTPPDSTTFEITCDATGGGNYSGTISFAYGTDAGGNPIQYSFGVTCMIQSPQTITLAFNGATSQNPEATGIGNILQVTTSDTNPTAAAATVTVTVLGGTANAADYNLTGTVTVPAGTPNNTLLSIDAGITITDDAVLEPDESVQLSLSAPSGAILGAQTTHTHTILNDDSASVSINDVTQNEGNSGTTNFTFTVTVDNPVQGGFSVNYATSNNTATAGTDYTVTSGTLTFTGTAGETQPITVSVLGDTTVESNETFFVTISNPSIASVTIADMQGIGTITNDDTAGVTITPTTLAITEGGATDAYTISLDSAPTGSVEITVTPSSVQCDVGTGASTARVLTFTNTTPQTITVTAVDDVVIEGAHTCAITNVITTSSAIEYPTGAQDSVTANITDNDNAVVNFVSGTGTTSEDTTPYQTSVVLSTGGASLFNSVTVTINQTAGSAATPDDYTLTTTSVTFPAGSVDGSTQSVDVAIADDILTETSETFTLSLGSITGTASAGTTTSQVVTINDNDSAGVTINPTSGSVTEGGSTAYDVVLTSQPTGDVTITPATGSSETTISPNPLTFTPANWDTPQTITLDVADNAALDGTRNATITHTATSVDANYNAVTVDDFALTINDNDSAGVTINPTSGSVTEGGSTTYDVVLTSQPTGDVTITPATGSSETTISPNPLTFTPANWDTPQTITLDVADNAVLDGTRNATITHTAASVDANYNAVTVDDFALTINDNDSAGVSINPTSGSVTEGGSTTYDVVLTSQPTGDVTITPATGSSETTISPNPLTFTPANWDTPQTITLDVADNAALDGTRNATITHTAASVDANYNAVTVDDFALTINDNDSAGVTINPTSLTITEGTSDIYDIVLTSQPTGDVIINLSVDDPLTCSVSPNPLTFTMANWDTPQTVTVNALSSGGTSCTISHTATGGGYDGVSIVDVSVTVQPVPIEPTQEPVEPQPTQEPATQPNIGVFDPALSKIGFLVPGQVGITDEQLEWVTTVSNTGTAAGTNVTIVDNVNSRLQVNSVNAPNATVVVNGNEVRVTYAVINPGETFQFSIFTTVLQGETVNNTICIAGTDTCATGSAVGSLPATGESRWWRRWMPNFR